jgi:hypothetical protein
MMVMNIRYLSSQEGEISHVNIEEFEFVKDSSSESEYRLCYTATFPIPGFDEKDNFKRALESSEMKFEVVLGFKVKMGRF